MPYPYSARPGRADPGRTSTSRPASTRPARCRPDARTGAPYRLRTTLPALNFREPPKLRTGRSTSWPGSGPARARQANDRRSAMHVSQQVTDASSELGLLLAIVALFTAALSTTLKSENNPQLGRASEGVVADHGLVSGTSSRDRRVARQPAAPRATRHRQPWHAFTGTGFPGIPSYILAAHSPLRLWQIFIAVGAFCLKRNS